MILACASSTVAHAELAVRTNRLAISVDESEDLSRRLHGLTFSIVDDTLVIDDVAGEGAPHIGVVARDGGKLVLDAADGRWTLTGPLARPRIAGPGYTVWVLGTPVGDGSMKVRRLGVLRRPVKP